MTELLDRIVARTRADVAARREAPLPARRAPDPRGRFRAALEGARSRGAPGLGLIAELKPRSPSHGPLRQAGHIDGVLEVYARRADAVSVLVDAAFFGGGLDLLARARARLDAPLLAKGFVLEPRQIDEAHAFGADAVLLIARLLEDGALAALRAHAERLGLATLVEVHTDRELERALQAGADVVGVNARDLDTLAIDLDAARARLDRVPPGVLRVAESGLRDRADVERVRGLAHACLVGAAFMAAEDVEAEMEALGW
jgi:indole-3-glycerol phosphate synthase